MAVDCWGADSGPDSRFPTDPSYGQSNLEISLILRIIGGGFRQRQAQHPAAVTWRLWDELLMDQLQAELAALSAQLTKQSEDTSSALSAVRDSLKAMATSNTTVCKNINGLNKCASAIDISIRDLLNSVEEVGTRVAILEAEHGDDATPRPDGHNSASATQVL